MKNTYSKNQARHDLNECFKSSGTYNEAVAKFFEQYLCKWLEINPAYLPTEPQKFNEGRIIPKTFILSEAMLNYPQKPIGR